MNVLQGIRVIDVTQNIAGPHSTQTLGDLGADVIKIEPPGGDPTRSWGPPFWEGEPPLFLSYNRNKRSVVLDLKSEGGRDVLWRLIDSADVFVQAYRAGVIEKLGFAYEQVRERRPDIIYASVTGYGSRGPLKERPHPDGARHSGSAAGERQNWEGHARRSLTAGYVPGVGLLSHTGLPGQRGGSGTHGHRSRFDRAL